MAQCRQIVRDAPLPANLPVADLEDYELIERDTHREAASPAGTGNHSSLPVAGENAAKKPVADVGERRRDPRDRYPDGYR